MSFATGEQVDPKLVEAPTVPIFNQTNVPTRLEDPLCDCVTFKICTACKQSKPINTFGKLHASSDGHTTRCMDCTKLFKKYTLVERYKLAIKTIVDYISIHDGVEGTITDVKAKIDALAIKNKINVNDPYIWPTSLSGFSKMIFKNKDNFKNINGIKIESYRAGGDGKRLIRISKELYNEPISTSSEGSELVNSININNNRICNRCNIEKPLSEYYKDPHGRGGYKGSCKVCDLKRSKERKLMNKTTPPTTNISNNVVVKYCSKCKLSKPLVEFGTNPTTKDGYQYHCKKCRNEYYNSHYGKNIKPTTNNNIMNNNPNMYSNVLFCVMCGKKKIKQEARFCGYCGEPLS